MSRYRHVNRIFPDKWEACSMIDDEPELFSTLAAAREELQDHLIATREAAQAGHMDEPHSPNDYAVEDTLTGRIIPLAWNRTMDTLLVRISFKDVLAEITNDLTGLRRMDLDFARVACDYGIEDNTGINVVRLPSDFGPEGDILAIAPAGWSREEAAQYANDLIDRTRRPGADGLPEREARADAICEGLAAAGFQTIGGDDANLAVTERWDDPNQVNDDDRSPPSAPTP